MKTFIAAMLVLMVYSSNGQELNKIIFDERANQEILYGYCTPDAFKSSIFEGWFNYEFDGYAPNAEILKNLNPLIDGVKIRIVLGTWCGDSQREFPRFMKILSQLEPIDGLTLEIICVNRSKTAEEIGIQAGYVDFVPSFIVFVNGIEKGRIIEIPQITLEEDLLNLLH